MLVTILNACLPVFTLIGVGYLLRRGRVLTAEADSSLLRVTLGVLFPAFIIDYLLGSEGMDQPLTVLLAAGCGALFLLIGLGTGYLAGGLIGKRGDARRSFAVASGMQNYGFIPIPILIALFGPATIGVHLMHTLGVEIALWTAAVMLLSGGRAGGWKNLLNAPLITTVVCLLLNFFGAGKPIAENGGFAMDAVSKLAACAVPVALLLIGATIRDLVGTADRSDSGPAVPEALAAISVRLLTVPALMLLFTALAPLPLELKRVLVVQAAMPAAVFPIILARRYGGDVGVAVRVVVATTLISVFTIPPVIVLGLRWAGAAP